MTTVLYIIGYFILLLYLPKVADNPIVKALPLMYFLVYYIYLTLSTRKLPALPIKRNYTAIHVASIILIIGLARTNKPDTILMGSVVKVLSFLAFLMCTIAYSEWYVRKRNKDFILFFFLVNLVPYLLYCFVNIFLWASGISVGKYEETTIGEALLLSQLGINIERVKFPLVTGFNSFATLLGGLFSVTLMGLVSSFRYKSLLWLSLAIIFVMLLMIDSRTALIYPVLCCLLVLFLKKREKIGILRTFPITQIFGPILLVLFLQLVSNIPFFASLSRSSEDLQTGNSRTMVWTMALTEFIEFKFDHIAGYGEYGHYESGASALWAPFFSSYENSEMMHPHNTILMILFDYGIIGLIAYFFLLYRSINMVISTWKFNKDFNSLIVTYLAYFLIIGITESFFGFYYLNSYYLLFSVLIVQAAVTPYIQMEYIRNHESAMLKKQGRNQKFELHHAH